MVETQIKRRFAALLLALALMIAAPVSAFAQLDSEDPRIGIINSSDLNPQDPDSEELDELLEEILWDIIDGDMSTYEQVMACYDYLVDNMRYGSHTGKLGVEVANGVTCNQIYSQYGSVEGYGAVALTSNVGMCNAYNSAFILMVRKIGLDAELVVGSTKSRGGGYAHHQWTEVDIDGTIYVFDPQLEQDLRKSGMGEYTVFCKTYDQTNGRYAK